MCHCEGAEIPVILVLVTPVFVMPPSGKLLKALGRSRRWFSMGAPAIPQSTRPNLRYSEQRVEESVEKITIFDAY
jgi:hypothetical protein